MTIVLLPDLALRISADKFLSASIRVSFYYPVSIWPFRVCPPAAAGAGSALSPKSCLPSATGLGTFGQSPKAAGTFRGPRPPFLRAASPYSSFRAKKRALRRPERCAAQVPACLSTVEPPPRRGNRSGFPGSKYSAPAPCRSGSKGEAPWSPKAKSRQRFLFC